MKTALRFVWFLIRETLAVPLGVIAAPFVFVLWLGGAVWEAFVDEEHRAGRMD